MLLVGCLEYNVWELGVAGDTCRESHVLLSMLTLLWLVDICVLDARFVLIIHMLHMEPDQFDQHLAHLKYKFWEKIEIQFRLQFIKNMNIFDITDLNFYVLYLQCEYNEETMLSRLEKVRKNSARFLNLCHIGCLTVYRELTSHFRLIQSNKPVTGKGKSSSWTHSCFLKPFNQSSLAYLLAIVPSIN